ncbi:MAG: Glu-tRNA(Gln) amidotransferase GatDE subunit D [Methanobacteriota archaeon]|nr:MAG: Glu-tRNA(Gln) amidotransferase GatDE subunit D [Euryarchaeota archaeon]
MTTKTVHAYGNYSKELIQLFSNLNVKVGDHLLIETTDARIEGNLLPQTEMGDPDVIILKQKNGYNVGIKYSKDLKIQTGGESFRLEKFPKIRLKQKEDLPQISLLATGGTIASRIDYLTGGVFMASKPEEVFASLPELFDEVAFKSIIPLFQMASEDIGYKQWQVIAEAAAKEFEEETDGIVIMHGTDMMGYTSAALSFMLQNLPAPIAMTGGQRSSDRGSFDGALNLISAARVAGKADFAKVCVVMHETTDDNTCLVSPGTRVRKMHTSRRDAFKTIGDIPYAKVLEDGKITMLRNDLPKRKEREVQLNTNYDPNVALIKIFPGISPEILDWYIDKGIKGFIIEGTGLGHTPTYPPEDEKERSWAEPLKRAIDDGAFVGMTSQCIYGRTHPFVYRALRTNYKAGVTYLSDMISETALVKLGWVLGNTQNMEEVKKLMTTNIAGEITEKTNFGGYFK